MKIIALLAFCLYYHAIQAQNKSYRIVITPDDSVYKWRAETPDGIREFSIKKGTVIYFNNEEKTIQLVTSICGRGACGDGVEISYYPNGMMERLGHYGYLTNKDSLKDTSHDGFMDYVGKDGLWFFWTEKGFLLKKEKWSKGRLLQTTFFSTKTFSEGAKKKKR